MSDFVSRRKLIRAVQDYLIALIEEEEEYVEITKFNVDIQKVIKNLPKEMNDWVAAENPPEKGRYVLLSFANFQLPAIGRYEEDETGGNYYIGDDEKSCLEEELYVNAWMPLPEAYEE